MYGIELGNEQRGFFVFTGGSAVLESSANSDDLFNLELVHMAVVDVVSYSGEGGEECLVNGFVVGEWNGCSCSAKWFGLNGGTSTYGWSCDEWRYILLV